MGHSTLANLDLNNDIITQTNTMALISTFEILLKPQLPKSITDNQPELAPLSRPILQGYFLTISNLSNKLVFLSLVVTTRSPGLEANKILTTLDTTGINGPVSTTLEATGENRLPGNQPPPGTPATDAEVRKTRFSIPLNGNDTGLFILQPNALNKKLREDANYELRGYVEVFLSSVSTPTSVDLLVTAEHRGTFFNADASQLGELAYALPLASGGSLLSLSRS